MNGSNITNGVGIFSRDDGVYNVTSFDRNFLHWSFIVLEVAIIVVVVVGDISVLMLFFTRKLLGQSTNILVFSLAIGDLMTGLLTFPLAMLQKILYEPSEFLCKSYFYSANVSKTAVSYTILLLAMERIAAVLSHTFRILPPGRCLFFASLTWFFSAAFNIWSVVIYDKEKVSVAQDDYNVDNAFSICFASTRFMDLHAIFEFLNPLVTFAFPVIFSSVLFIGFWCKKDKADKPGRPYKSSKSVVIFTFAVLISFIASHLPWEIANIVIVHDASVHSTYQLLVLKILHIFSSTRGFWDIFIFGAFRRYVCKKEKALAHFREQRSLQVQRSSLAIPMADRPASLSLLDSDPSVSRRYSSDCTISRRPSGMEESCMVLSTSTMNGGGQHYGHEQQTNFLEPPHDKPSNTITTTIIAENCLIPRSPCLHDQSRRFSFAPPLSQSSRGVSSYGDQLQVPKFGHRHSLSHHSAEKVEENEKMGCSSITFSLTHGDAKSKESVTWVPERDSINASSDFQTSAQTVRSVSFERRKSVPEGHRTKTSDICFVLPTVQIGIDEDVDVRGGHEDNELVTDSKQTMFLETNFDVDVLTPITTSIPVVKKDIMSNMDSLAYAIE